MNSLRIAMLVAAGALTTTWIGGQPAGGLAQAAEPKATVSPADKQFLEDAYNINEGEILLGQLAQQNGMSQAVKDFGQRMIADHSRSLGVEMRAALRANVMLPTHVDATTQAQYADLSRRSGRDFDTAYADAMVSGHERAIRLFSDEATTGTNPAVRSYAQNELPMLQEHLKLARDLAQSVKQLVALPQRRAP